MNHSYQHVINLEDGENLDNEEEVQLEGEDIDTPYNKLFYNDLIKNSPFPCSCVHSMKMDGRVTGTYNFYGAKIGPTNLLEDQAWFNLSCKMYNVMRKMQKRVEARKGKSLR